MADMPLIASEHVQLIDAVELSRRMRRSLKQLAESTNRNRLFFVERSGIRLFPDFFGDRRFRRRHLYEVCEHLGSLPGGSKLQFFSTPKGSLGQITPLEALQRGGMLSKVKKAADGFTLR
jgi:hypothetical protein